MLTGGRTRPRRSAGPGRVVARLVVALLALLLAGWGLGALTRSIGQSWDLDVVRDLAGDRVGLLTAVAHALSLAGSGFVVFPLAAAFAAALYRRGRVGAALALVVSTLGAVVIANVDKLVVARPRPPVRHLEHVISPSFPSGHATQASAFYITLLLIFLAGRPGRGLAVPAVIAAVGVVLGIAVSRVYLGVHYPTDTISGMFLGASWCVLASSLLLRPRSRAGSGS